MAVRQGIRRNETIPSRSRGMNPSTRISFASPPREFRPRTHGTSPLRTSVRSREIEKMHQRYAGGDHRVSALRQPAYRNMHTCKQSPSSQNRRRLNAVNTIALRASSILPRTRERTQQKERERTKRRKRNISSMKKTTPRHTGARATDSERQQPVTERKKARRTASEITQAYISRTTR